MRLLEHIVLERGVFIYVDLFWATIVSGVIVRLSSTIFELISFSFFFWTEMKTPKQYIVAFMLFNSKFVFVFTIISLSVFFLFHFGGCLRNDDAIIGT